MTQVAQGPGPQQTYPERVEFSGTPVIWYGHTVAGHFVVQDITDKGVSQRTITGQAPDLKPIPLAAITEQGGKVKKNG